MKFEEAGVSSGVACNADGAFQAGMGTACGDLDGDGLPTCSSPISTASRRPSSATSAPACFSDQTAAIGLAGPSRFLLGFGIALLDADNDGRLDLATANGHVNDDRPDYPYADACIAHDGGQGRPPDRRHHSGRRAVDRSAGRPRPGRRRPRQRRPSRPGARCAELSPLAYFHNQTDSRPCGQHSSWKAPGPIATRVGAVVTITAGGRRRRAWRHGGGSFLSASDPRIHFGLGDDRIDQVEVRWPSGQLACYGPVEADRCYRLREGESKAVLLRSFPGR